MSAELPEPSREALARAVGLMTAWSTGGEQAPQLLVQIVSQFVLEGATTTDERAFNLSSATAGLVSLAGLLLDELAAMSHESIDTILRRYGQIAAR